MAAPGLSELVRHAEQAVASDEAWPALRDFLYAAVDAQITDASIASVLASPQPALPLTGELLGRLNDLSADLLDRARAAGAVDPSITPGDVASLLCGVTFAARVHSPEGVRSRTETARRYLDVLFGGCTPARRRINRRESICG
ncbi:hypothetical protein Asp14428_74310 [Actinoplanes sp. NBRC 14428]|nr:hypothetical protein Asp14428_74310 [Actinoplanes sp. NBRC 14428]